MFVPKSVRTALVASAALLLSAQSAVAQAVPSAADVIAKHVAAIGGKDAIRKMTSYKHVATMELPSAGLTAEVEVQGLAPNKMTTKATLPGIGDVISGTDGQNAWSTNPMQGPRVLDGKEKEQAIEQADFYAGMLFPAESFSSITNEGPADFGGEKTWKLKFVRKGSGTITTRYFSVASGLEIGTESTATTEMGTTESTILLSDYKEFGGVKFPTKTQTTMGPQTMIMTIKSVEPNAAVTVTVPAAIAPLIKK
ncbi:hypothetical protein [Gemmatimonas sp.]|uniref:hypothetical protein n=1 Tax=Gemmatimonas sp. TaxID=1962908 RepID=UPI003F71BAE6